MSLQRWLLLLVLGWGWSQNDLDAERWTSLMPQGTARGLGMGGAFSALGGDPTNLTQNPAGLGLFMRGGFWLSPTIYVPTVQTSYNQQSASDGRTHLALNHLSLILRGGGGKNITQWAFGFGYNQEGFFHQNATARAFNNRNSFTQAVAEQADGIPDTLLGGTAALAYLNFFDLRGQNLGYRGVIDLVSATGPPLYRGVFYQGGILQEITSQEKGRLNTWAIGTGLSYQNRIFFGASILIRSLSYSKLYRLREIDETNRYNGANNTTPADFMTFREKYSSNGSGLGLALGVLVEPVDFLRFGISFTTGSRIRINDEYNAELEFGLDDGRTNITKYAEPFQYTYRLAYPYRATAGVAFLIKQRGAVSIEADFLDYRTAAFSSTDYSYDRENEIIEQSFASALNVRVGMEWLLTDELFLRGGYAYYSPQRNADARQYYPDMMQPQALSTLPMERQFFSLGGGYSTGSFSVDVAYVLGLSAFKYLPYSLRNPVYAPAPVIVMRGRTHFIVTTLGFRFGKS
jgi:hypothetical protein